MGKASKFKKLRRLASQMPVINRIAIVGKAATGQEVIDAGIKIVEGKEVDVKEHYRLKQGVQVPMNHHRQLKKVYNQQGSKGLHNYVKAVRLYAEQRAAEEEKSKKDPVEEPIQP